MNLQAIRRIYAGWAPVYDATHAWIVPYRRQARLALHLQRGERVLDLACGTGLNFAHLRELVGSEGHVMGIDLSPDMLALANRKITRHGWVNVETRETDAAQLPFSDSAFDKAICAFAMNVIPNYARAIEEVERVLMPGGRFIVLDAKLDRGILQGPLRPVARMHICGAEINHRTVDEMRRVFSSIQVQEHWGGFVYIASGMKTPRPTTSQGGKFND